MLDPEDVGRRLKKHFDEVSDEEFLRILRQVTTDTEWAALTRNRTQPIAPPVPVESADVNGP
jgi:hypothetical protein